MIKSMTGFGRCEVQEGDRKITVEMKSVNHRYLDMNVKMPKKTPNRTPEQDRITKILQNIDRYNGTSNGQVKVEVDR